MDSEEAWGEAERRVVLGYGRPWDPAIRLALLGRGPDDAARTLAAHLQVADHREVSRRLLQEAVKAFTIGILPRDGAAELLKGLAGRVRVAVATNSRRVLADLSMASAGLDDLVEEMVCAEDVAAPKPAPDPYLRACERVGADPRYSVCLEDSPVGAASAKAAGLWVVGCPSLPDVVVAEADVVVASLTEVDPEALLGG